ncbi:DUF5667 domain-containing protein [Streptomyces poonensis]|uniref:DUF5667 domain-containing protein n=1 Tax=Streptomyces poonensis TaxID=68255 RepID=A0A918PLD4_9ACTN|nr:DUF5667 domain-containing protein [Streptomyces poonensis]GGZ14985.1 hypothetical protein GCM10010365_38310 [Streptomyces poonensis]GLJ91435.1 hypothetical protein GCM10017589_40420 [Streptomyces poonensis]
MIANVSAHRRANAFAQALEELSDRDTVAEQPDVPAPAAAERTEQGRLLALATGLGGLPKPELDPEVKVVQRARLVAAMEAMLQEGTAGQEAADPSVPPQKGSHRARGTRRASPLGKLRPRSRLSKGLAAGGLSVGVAAGAFGGVAAASSDALPGDSLYGLKRGIEDFKLTMADDSTDRGRLYLDQASTRLGEARRLMERDRARDLDHEDLGEIRRALNGMRHDAEEGHRLLREAYEHDPDSLDPIQALSAFSSSHRGTWGALRDRLPVQLGDVSQQVSSVFDAIDDEVAPLQSLLPQAPAQSGDGRQRGTGPGSTSSTETGDRPAPSDGDSPESGHHSGGDTPQPSASQSGGDSDSEGLLGGTTGGLLDPPKEDATSSSPSAGKSTPSEEPDVTLPPILPGLLPDLGIDGQDTE